MPGSGLASCSIWCRIPSPAQRLKAYPHETSGGIRQWAMIALALSCNPGLLRADEPTTALGATVHGGMRGQRLEAIPGAPPDLGMAPTACSFAPRCKLAEPRCTSAPPPLAAVGEGHQVRCVLAT